MATKWNETLNFFSVRLRCVRLFPTDGHWKPQPIFNELVLYRPNPIFPTNFYGSFFKKNSLISRILFAFSSSIDQQFLMIRLLPRTHSSTRMDRIRFKKSQKMASCKCVCVSLFWTFQSSCFQYFPPPLCVSGLNRKCVFNKQKLVAFCLNDVVIFSFFSNRWQRDRPRWPQWIVVPWRRRPAAGSPSGCGLPIDGLFQLFRWVFSFSNESNGGRDVHLPCL